MAFNLFKKDKKEPKKKAAKPVVSDAPQVQDAAESKGESAVPAPVGTGSVIKHMHVSEKSSYGNAVGQYTFVVTPNATKPQVATEVQKRYGVSVRSVKMVKLPSKSRRIGRYFGSRSGIKKAIVVLKEGQSIIVG